ncbi:MraY family glycosyltransferase [Dokdonella soli]|uniref:UDP-N-acetylglucosamine--undecaprenyl-phosphate N-acetylglucosaminephosphotransferase n=1 Tax=Dokdonella soli TaxID=529810 RepID=A0ABP3TJI3_9GAMM
MLQLMMATASVTVAFVLTLAGQWMLTPLARRFDLFDHPAGRKDHACPTPTTGGIVMLMGALLAEIAMRGDSDPSFYGFYLAAIILTVLGVLDDKLDLPWPLRIAVEVVVALVVIYVGGIRVHQLGDAFGLNISSLGILSVPFTVCAIVGTINAINMIDGSDGMAGLLVLSALVMLEAAALYAGNDLIQERAPILIGAVMGFLFHNLRLPGQRCSRVFMGNAGSAFLGLAIACCAFHLTQTPTHPVSPALGLWLVPVPIMDCLVLMVSRIRKRRSPFAADHDHIHHLMLEGGFGPTRAACVLALLSSVCGLIAGVTMRAHVPHPVLLVAFVCLCALWYWMTSRRSRAIRFFQWLRADHAWWPAPISARELDT